MEKKTTPKFLPNKPIGKDLFEGKSQDKIACVLAEILTKNDFQIVGIDGGWGTGKSNLVKIIENKLDDCNFFIYDVWGHQEDDQRKAILVELTEFISNEESKIVSDSKKWKNKLKRLLSKEKEVTTINNPYLSIGFIFSLFSIIYVPSVNVFKDTIVDFFEIKKIFWKLVLVLLPIFIVVIIYIYNLLRFWKNKMGFFDSFKLASQETFQVYTNKQKEETKTETISENEPSVKDFRSWMKEIDKDLNSNKLILVFDNFDRLPKKHILSIWSSIHVFFSEDKYENIKVIIPFDRIHIKNAFKELNGENKDYANDYINKTFDLVYRVSPPILSDWKSFFKGCWLNAFIDINEEEYLKVEQIYEVFRITITPREIIAFINEVVSIKLLDDGIPDKYVAIFVLNKDIILSDPLKAIIESDFLLGLSYLYKDDEDFQKFITALAYQINPENALEVVYRKQLKDSLVNKNVELFTEISKTTIFNKIVVPILSEIDNLENAILTLDHISNESKISKIETQSIWNNLYLRIKLDGHSIFSLEEFQKVLLVKIDFNFKKNYVQKILNELKDNEDFSAVKYSDIIEELNELMNKNSLNIDVFEYLQNKATTVESFIPLVKKRKNNFIDFKITCPESDVDNYLANVKIENIEETAFVEFIAKKYKLDKFDKSLKDKITSNKSNKENLKKLFKIIKFLRSRNLVSLLSDDEIYTLFTASTNAEEFYFDLVAMRLARGKEYHVSYQTPFVEILNSEDKSTIIRVAKNIEFYTNYEELLLNSITFNTSELYKGVVREVVVNSYNTNVAEIKNLLPEFEKICETNGLDPQVFINDLDGWDEESFTTSFIKSLPSFYFEESMKNSTNLAKNSIKLLADHFNSLQKEDWKIVFIDLDGNDAKLLNSINYRDWNSHSLEALKEVLIDIAKSTKIDKSNNLTKLINDFESAGKDLSNAFKDIRDELIFNRNTSSSLFVFFGEWLFKYAKLDEKPADVLRTIFKTTLLDDDNSVTLMINHSLALKNLISSCKDSDFNDLKEGIKDRFDKPLVGELAKLLGVRKRKSVQDEN